MFDFDVPFDFFKMSGEDKTTATEKVEEKEKMLETNKDVEKKKEKNAQAKQKEREIRDVIAIAMG